MRKHLWMLAVLGCMFMLQPVAAAEPAPTEQETVDSLRRKVADLESRLASMQKAQEQQAVVREELKEYRAFVEQERKEMREYLQLLIGIGGAVVFLLLGVAEYLGWRTRSQGDALIQRSIDSLREEAKVRIESVPIDFEAALRKLAAQSLTEIGAMRAVVDREVQYRRARVLFLGQQEHLDGLADVVALLRGKGITVTLSKQVDDLPARLRQGKTDFVIYRYHDQDEHRTVVDAVADSGMNIPLIVFTDGNTNLDHSPLTKYPWGTFANNRPTLVSHLYMLTHLFQSGERL